MNYERDLHAKNSSPELQKIIADLRTLAEKHKQDSLFLLCLLRSLESIHREIRIEMFESSLPDTRNDLYQLVKDIEEKGGWPYIERMKLQDLLRNLRANPDNMTEPSQYNP
ncbi:hypothetical protein IQ238_17130 [Pleurocapsales cyanobacterium LEGE 06147]|nr:hypothetical protein [Pleurocapsales cyanobacterium LEGE 06147]